MDLDDESIIEPLRTSPRLGKSNSGKKKLHEDVDQESTFADRANKKRRTGNTRQSKVGVDKQNVGFKCSPHLMHSLYQSLSEDQRAWVQELGFGMLSTMPSCILPKGLTVWLINQVSWKKKALIVGGRSIQIKKVMKTILGIPDGLHAVPLPRCKRGKTKGSKTAAGDREYKEGKAGRGVSYKTTYESLIGNTDPVQFKRSFMLYVLCIYFAPSSGLFINRSYASIINDVDLIKEMNWCDHVADVLIEGVRDYRESKALNVNVHGCVHILLLIYIDIVKSAFIKVPPGTPRALYVDSAHVEQLDYHDLKYTTHDGPVYGKLEIDQLSFYFTAHEEQSPPISCSPKKNTAGRTTSIVSIEDRKYVKESISDIDKVYALARERAYEVCFRVLRRKISKIETERSCAISEVHEKLFHGRIMPSQSYGQATSSLSRQPATIPRTKTRSITAKPVDCVFSTPRKETSVTKSVNPVCRTSSISTGEFSFQYQPSNPAQKSKFVLSLVDTSASSPSTPTLGRYVCPPSVQSSSKSLDLHQNCRKFSTFVMLSKGSSQCMQTSPMMKPCFNEAQFSPPVHSIEDYDYNDPLGFDIMSACAALGKECEGQALLDSLSDGIRNPDPDQDPVTSSDELDRCFDGHPVTEVPNTELANQSLAKGRKKTASSTLDYDIEGHTDKVAQHHHSSHEYFSINDEQCIQSEMPFMETIDEDNGVIPVLGPIQPTDMAIMQQTSLANSPSKDVSVISPDMYVNTKLNKVQIGTEEQLRAVNGKRTICVAVCSPTNTPHKDCILNSLEDSTSTNMILEPTSNENMHSVECKSGPSEDPLVEESSQLFTTFKTASDQHLPDINQFRQEIEFHGNYIQEAGQPHKEFSAPNLVCLPLTGDPEQRFINYVRGDIRNLQTLLSKAPVNKEALISEIDTNLTLWKGWFASPRPDVERLAKSLVALREALAKDHSALAKEAASWRDAINKQVTVVDKYRDEVAVISVSMNRITSTFEKQLAEQELRKRGYVDRAQEIKAQIKKLEDELEEVEKERPEEESSMKRATSALDDHKRRNSDVTDTRTHLELLSSQDHDLLNKADTLMDHVDPGESGFSVCACSLRDFLMACPS